MSAQLPLIPYLKNVKRWIWLGIMGGALAFLGIVLLLAARHPTTPAQELTGWENGWLFLLPVVMAGYGLYVSARYWRCPRCGESLPTQCTVPTHCRHCGAILRANQPGPASSAKAFLDS